MARQSAAGSDFFSDSDRALASVASGALPLAALCTISTLLKGYISRLAIAALLTAFATATRIGADLMETLTVMFNPCPRSRSCHWL